MLFFLFVSFFRYVDSRLMISFITLKWYFSVCNISFWREREAAYKPCLLIFVFQTGELCPVLFSEHLSSLGLVEPLSVSVVFI